MVTVDLMERTRAWTLVTTPLHTTSVSVPGPSIVRRDIAAAKHSSAIVTEIYTTLKLNGMEWFKVQKYHFLKGDFNQTRSLGINSRLQHWL